MLSYGFTIFDSAAGRYLDPFFCPSIEFAIREFRTAVNTEGHQFAKYPSDYTLFSIGIYDGETGLFRSKEPTSLGVAITFVDVSPLRLEGEA